MAWVETRYPNDPEYTNSSYCYNCDVRVMFKYKEAKNRRYIPNNIPNNGPVYDIDCPKCYKTLIISDRSGL